MVSIGSFCPGRFGTRKKFFIYFAVAYEKHRNICPKRSENDTKKAEGLPLLTMIYGYLY